MNKKVLILGGGGFIGLNIAKAIAKKDGYEVTIADLVHPGQKDLDFINTIKEFSINVVKGDFTQINNFKKLEKDYDDVYMLASIVGVNHCIDRPHDVIRINTALIQNTLNWMINSNIKKILFSSSSECYSASTDTFNYPIPTNEDVPLTISDISHPRFTYAVTKILGESAFLTYGKQYGIPTTIVRYQNIFGPRMGFKHVIPHLVQRFYNKLENPFKIYGSNQTRAFCYITDAAKGTILAMENQDSDQEIFHIGSSDEISIETLVKAVGELMDYQGEYISAPTYPGSVSRRCPDISKSIKNLNYLPKVKWLDGLKDTVRWYIDFYESGKEIYSGGFKAPNDLLFKE